MLIIYYFHIRNQHLLILLLDFINHANNLQDKLEGNGI